MIQMLHALRPLQVGQVSKRPPPQLCRCHTADPLTSPASPSVDKGNIFGGATPGVWCTTTLFSTTLFSKAAQGPSSIVHPPQTNILEEITCPIADLHMNWCCIAHMLNNRAAAHHVCWCCYILLVPAHPTSPQPTIATPPLRGRQTQPGQACLRCCSVSQHAKLHPHFCCTPPVQKLHSCACKEELQKLQTCTCMEVRSKWWLHQRGLRVAP